MTCDEPNVRALSRYDINQTCALLSISRKTLLKYTVRGAIKCGFRPHDLKKFYTGKEILRFWRVVM